MKKKFTFQNALLFALLLIGIYKFSFLSAEKSTKSITMSGDTLGFTNYVTAPGWVDTAPGNFWNITNQFDSYKELNYNTSQMFVSESDSLGYFNQDVLSSEQKARLQRIALLSNQIGLNCYLERVRISALCYSQRLIYEAEGGNYGFSYQRRTANIETDGDRTVVHACRIEAECPQTDATPRMLLDSIYENLQHTDLYYFWPGSTDNLRWKIKPVMKIDSNVFSAADTTPVVAIITKNYLGIVIDSTIIRVNSFGLNNYSGNYIQSYFGLPHPLEVKGHVDSVNSLNYGRPAPGHDIKACKVDFKVYWFGQVDVWFDKMIVDDARADLLFNGIFDIKIEDEVSTLGNSIIYYVDELTSSQASTTKYVRDKMRSYSNGKATMQFALSNNLNIYSNRDPDTRNKMLFDTIQPDIVCLDDHVFLCDSANLIYLPNNAAGYDPKVPDHWKNSPSEYNTRLQTRAFGNKSEIVTPFQGTFIYQITKIRNDLRQLSPHTKFTVQPHLHSWTMTVENEQYYKDNGFREPTNQEIQAEGMIAIANAAQGLSWVNYQSNSSSNINAIHDTLVTPNDTTFTIFGLRNDDTTKRTSNIIHQDKWNYLKAMNLKILHWKPTLDKVKWDNGYSVHYEGADHNYISDIKSIYRIPSAPFTFSPSNEDATKYWEMGFFDPDFDNSSVDQYDKSKYFIMVNRRCVPESYEGIGDIRSLKIKFDSTDLNQFNNWRITDINTGDTMTFNVKNQGSGGFLDLGGSVNSLGYFDPGEGKLFKLAPVMQEGGTLVAEEEVQGITFVCNAPVYNNGKSISILEGTKIEFKSGAGINMNGGSLLCSNNSTNTEENVLLKGYNSQNWNGIALDNTYKSKIQRTRFEDTKTPLSIESSSGVNLYNAKIIRKNYFKITGDSGKALSIRNQHSVSIDSNTFDITSYNSTAGIYFENNMSTESEIIPAGSPQEDPEDVFAGYINITKNKFIGACFPVILDELGDNFSAYYIYNNEFVNTGLFGITARKISGIIKQNRFTDESQNYCLYLIESFPDVTANIFRSEKRNIVLTNSFPMLAPLRNENGQLIFKGGRNSLIITTNSEPAENIYLKYSLPDIKLGENNFAIGNSYSYHIFGSIPPEGERYYNAIRNCWEGYNGLPSIFLFQGNDTNRLGYNYIPVSCIPSEETAREIQSLGFGIIDTTIVTAYDSANILSDDESLFYGAREFEETGNNTDAIADFKALIDNHDSSKYIYPALDNLYSCYQALDTSSNEEITDVLYSDLKQYLETKISSGNYDEEFEKNAYSFSLMCDTRLTNYNDALAGYEFIATYNPDAEQRLMASWEYENIEEMMNGEGGGERNLEFGMSDLEFEKTVEKRIKKLDEFVDRDPIKRHIKEEYVKTSNKNENSKTVREGIYTRKNPNEEKLIERSRQNIYGSKNLSKQQKEIRRFEDMKLLLNPENLEVNKKIENAIPVEYSLSQNYPNPFNPITHLEYGISNLGFVSLKVYDVLGREIKTLVNEIKPAGKYKIEFDGSNFASGVYFYRIEAGEFVQTKRMVLVK